MRRINKYTLYEISVQSPELHAKWFAQLYKEIFDRYPRLMREDFGGTFNLSSAWVERNRKNEAIAIDLDDEPLKYGMRNHWPALTKDQRSRLHILHEDVLNVTYPKVDMTVACNFSFYIFKKRPELIRYFKNSRAALKSDGVLLLEMAGGPGMIKKMKEQKTVKLPDGKKFVYVWDQKSFDPISRDAKYGIHFKLPDGSLMKDAFTYDWRLWTIPEVRECLDAAGFDESHVYWETAHAGVGTGEFLRTEEGTNDPAWICYVLGVKRAKSGAGKPKTRRKPSARRKSGGRKRK